MKLAEALILRADLQKRIEQLRTRLNNNAKVQENDIPAENPENLLTELDDCVIQLTSLIKRINRTNCNSFSGNISLSDMIAERDILTLKAGILRNFIEIAGRKVELYSNKEIRILSTVNLSALQKELDGLSKKIRETDTELQKANWNIDLIEH